MSQLRVKYVLGVELAGDELKILLRLENQNRADENGQLSLGTADARALNSD